jgi:hypothetical protein
MSSEKSHAVEIRCPSCRKVSSIPLPPPEIFDCPRCRCELAPLARIRGEAASLLRRARANLLRGAHAQALAAASSSWNLRHSRAAASIAFVAATIACDTPEAIAWLRAARRLEG